MAEVYRDYGRLYPTDRRGFLRGAALLAAGGAAAPWLLGAQAPKRPPNFLFLFTDDQTFRSVHALNNPEVLTPNLDRLVARGVVFTHCFNQGSWSGAVCICSRAMLNTGQFLYHAQEGIDRVPLWGETFTRRGWDTFMTGKWHNGAPAVLRSFSEGVCVGAGMYESPGQYERPKPGDQADAWRPDDETLAGHWHPRVWDFVPDGKGGRKAGSAYTVNQHTSELYADKAIEYLRRPERREKPFFMYVSFNAPHDPRQSPRRFLAMYPPERITVPPSFLPEHPFDQGDPRIRDEMLAPFPRTEAAVRVHRSEYYAIITHFDEQIGRILDALEASGQADNTYILFSADHGLAVGQHGLMGKQNQYDDSVRMPLIVCGPGLAAGRRVDRMVYLHSLYATTCDLAGIPAPETVEFPSLAPLLSGRSEEPVHDAIFGSYRHFQRMVRTEEWKLIVYPMVGRTQLFDLRADPWEMTDLSGQPAMVARVSQLRQRLRELQQIVGDTLDLDHPAPPTAPRRPGPPVTADSQGVFRLTPATASVTGALRFQPERENLGAWFNASDTPIWALRGVKTGTYRVTFEYGCTNPGVRFAVRCGTASVRSETRSTGGIRTYQAFDLGTVALHHGEVAVEIVPEAFTGALMNVRGLTLTPVPPPRVD